jgi:CheY-like chemotaxis protein
MPNLRILVVDDEPMVLDSVALVLSHDGHTVERASEAVQALTKYHSSRFDLVLTDLRLPGMQGDELAEEIKRKNPQQKIILVTAFPPDSRPPSCDHMLLKPFSVAQLRDAIQDGFNVKAPVAVATQRSQEGDESPTFLVG